MNDVCQTVMSVISHNVYVALCSSSLCTVDCFQVSWCHWDVPSVSWPDRSIPAWWAVNGRSLGCQAPSSSNQRLCWLHPWLVHWQASSGPRGIRVEQWNCWRMCHKDKILPVITVPQLRYLSLTFRWIADSCRIIFGYTVIISLLLVDLFCYKLHEII